MAGLPWFKVYSNIVGHPKTRALEEATGNPEALAYIVRLMSWFNEYAPSGRADGARTARAIERACEWRGDTGALLAALESCGWLDRDGGDLCLHDWDDVQGSHITKAAKDAEAKKLKRLQAKEAKLAALLAQKRREIGAETARAENADGAAAARVEESRGEESREERKDLPPPAFASAASGQGDLLPDTGAPPAPPPPESLQEIWNRVAQPKGLQRWSAMGKRKDTAKARLKAEPRLDAWEAFLVAKLAEPFFLGENERRWKADVEWFLRADRPAQVTDFADSPPSPPASPATVVPIRRLVEM